MEIKSLKVSEVNRYIKRLLDSDPILFNLKVKGELSNVKYHNNGHIYFTLKDENSVLRCVMFYENAIISSLPLKDGMEVIVKGSISVYERGGQYQLNAKDIQLDGVGKLYEEYLERKNMLEKEGYFDEKRKLKLPYFPDTIGIVTAKTGAAIEDLRTVIHRRNPKVKIIFYPAIVQGPYAPSSISKGIRYFNDNPVDLMIIGRGGGSLEELWAFNEMKVIDDVIKSKIPIISAVGHEKDYSITDYVSDLRAGTPSIAGEMAVPVLSNVIQSITDKKLSLSSIIKQKLKYEIQKCQSIRQSLDFYSPLNTLKRKSEQLDLFSERLTSAIHNQYKDHYQKLKHLSGLLEATSPKNILKRGYSFITDNDSNLLSKKASFQKGDSIQIHLYDGIVNGKVTEILEDDIHERNKK